LTPRIRDVRSQASPVKPRRATKTAFVPIPTSQGEPKIQAKRDNKFYQQAEQSRQNSCRASVAFVHDDDRRRALKPRSHIATLERSGHDHHHLQLASPVVPLGVKKAVTTHQKVDSSDSSIEHYIEGDPKPTWGAALTAAVAAVPLHEVTCVDAPRAYVQSLWQPPGALPPEVPFGLRVTGHVRFGDPKPLRSPIDPRRPRLEIAYLRNTITNLGAPNDEFVSTGAHGTLQPNPLLPVPHRLGGRRGE
jgi:hypothetical protein